MSATTRAADAVRELSGSPWVYLARRVAGRLVEGGGAVGLLGASLAGVIIAEGRLARWRIGVLWAQPPAGDGHYGTGDGEPIRLVVVGDSLAGGYGVDTPPETPGALLATAIAAAAGRPVELHCVAVVGAESHELDGQVGQALAYRPDVAIVIVGGNDVTHHVPPARCAEPLRAALGRLVAGGCAVVMGTCPDLGTVRPIAPPLRQLAGAWGRRLARVQERVCRDVGAVPVPLDFLVGPQFRAAPRRMFGPDRFHPSAAGYASAVAALLPATLAAVGVTGPAVEAAVADVMSVVPPEAAARMPAPRWWQLAGTVAGTTAPVAAEVDGRGGVVAAPAGAR